MNLLFFDNINWDYDVATPYESPLGGSQSALAYLAVELARRGHQIVAANNTSKPRQVLGVNCIAIRQLDKQVFHEPWDAIIVLNGPAELGPTIKPLMPPSVPLVLWTQHAHDQPAMQKLANPDIRACWDVFVCMSTIHRQQMIAQYHLDPQRTIVLQNGIAPAFENLFSSAEELTAAKGDRPVLAYTSTPFRGLDALLALFSGVREWHPDALLRIYSSMLVYGTREENDEHRWMYEKARDAPGIEYIGSLPQPRLASELRAASFLAYPNTFAEMYCISIIEAMAAGLFVVTTDLGALPETLMGHGALVPPLLNNDDVLAFVTRFAARLIDELSLRARDPRAFAERQFAQVRLVNERCNYRARASEWEAAIPHWPLMCLYSSVII